MNNKNVWQTPIKIFIVKEESVEKARRIAVNIRQRAESREICRKIVNTATLPIFDRYSEQKLDSFAGKY